LIGRSGFVTCGTPVAGVVSGSLFVLVRLSLLFPFGFLTQETRTLAQSSRNSTAERLHVTVG
jgi:hypothetical protein